MTQPQKIQIIYQDAHIIAVNKVSGMLCVPGLSSPENLFDSVKHDFPHARVVHRLDMATSGLVLFALNHEAQKKLGQRFELRQIRKTYIAIVHGNLHDDHGEIHSSMLCDWPNRPRQKIDWLNGKKASTYFSVLERCDEKKQSRVLLKPYTGRTHQLRLHMHQLKHPIVGDELYQTFPSDKQYKRLLLHAQTLEFSHPVDNTPIKLLCNPDF